jgi:parvulin-like peptidyl-prolyl isomerase
VPGNYFAQVQRALAQQMRDSMNENNSYLITYQIWRQAFEETAARTAILDEVKQAGYGPPSETVDRRVAQRPEFQENGKFSSLKYREYDNAARISIWRETRDSIALEKYIDDVTGLRISSKEADFIAAMASPQRRFDLAAFPLDSYPDTEVTAYFNDNPGLSRITRLSKITVLSSEAEAGRILDSIRNGETTFEDAARTYSQDSYADRGGDLGIKMVHELITEVPGAEERDALAALGEGEYSPVYSLADGWAFFRCEAASYPADLDDSANLEKARAYIMSNERGRVEDWVFEQAENFVSLVKDNGFDTAALMRGVDKKSFGPLPVNYGERRSDSGYYGGYSTDGVDLFTSLSSFAVDELYSAASMENFWRAAFFTPISVPANPIVVGNNVIVLYPVEETTPEPESADGIKSAYTSYWVSYNMEQSLKPFFLRSNKFQDRFMETFSQIYSFGL